MKKKINKDELDDGRTLANMDVEGMPGKSAKAHNRKQREYDVSKEEKRHLIFAGYKAMLPVLLFGILGMFLAMLLIKWWLS